MSYYDLHAKNRARIRAAAAAAAAVLNAIRDNNQQQQQQFSDEWTPQYANANAFIPRPNCTRKLKSRNEWCSMFDSPSILVLCEIGNCRIVHNWHEFGIVCKMRNANRVIPNRRSFVIIVLFFSFSFSMCGSSQCAM